jgi:hypothetical protein
LLSLQFRSADYGAALKKILTKGEDGMTSENYKNFAVASLNSTEGVKDLTDKIGLLIIANAWLELAEQTTQLLGHEAEEAHRMIERPLTRATV